MSDDDENGIGARGKKYLLDAGTVKPAGGKYRIDATSINGYAMVGTVPHLNIAGAPAELHDEMEVQGFLALVAGDGLYLDPRDLSWVKTY
jgi:hypothetical protein